MAKLLVLHAFFAHDSINGVPFAVFATFNI